MRQLMLTGILIMSAYLSFSQKEEENGTIYIKHPYIDVVVKGTQAYNDKDYTALAATFADSATVWLTSMEKPVPFKEAIKDWSTDRDFYDSVNVTMQGYPDYLHYKDKDQKVVQSWWTWSGKSKKTGQPLKVHFVQFDIFNKDGKIDAEYLYGDFSKLVKE